MKIALLAKLIPVILTLTGLATASVWALQQGWADYQFQQETVAATEQAISLTPDNAAYVARLAELVLDEDPGRAKTALRSATALNPWDAGSWIDLKRKVAIARVEPKAPDGGLFSTTALRTTS